MGVVATLPRLLACRAPLPPQQHLLDRRSLRPTIPRPKRLQGLAILPALRGWYRHHRRGRCVLVDLGCHIT